MKYTQASGLPRKISFFMKTNRTYKNTPNEDSKVFYRLVQIFNVLWFGTKTYFWVRTFCSVQESFHTDKYKWILLCTGVYISFNDQTKSSRGYLGRLQNKRHYFMAIIKFGTICFLSFNSKKNLTRVTNIINLCIWIYLPVCAS